MPPIPPSDDSIQIREVWASNLDAEFELIRGAVENFPYVAMDTEFPGIVIRPIGDFKTSSDFNYATLKANVDFLKLVKLCLTFSDEDGNLPHCGTGRGGCVWQFNFRELNPENDCFANDSIQLLRQSGINFDRNTDELNPESDCGINFDRNTDDGVDARRFGELLMSSGVVINGAVHWVTFHGGYDFGHLLKLLTCQSLPETQAGFFSLINIYFPNLYDIKYLMKYCNIFHGGLNELAELLDVKRVGICHPAGSDCLLTLRTFQRLKESFFNGSPERYAGVLYGLGVENGNNE